jgi:CheY-like chemotaxis protein
MRQFPRCGLHRVRTTDEIARNAKLMRSKSEQAGMIMDGDSTIQGHRIMVVDDEPGARAVIADLLELNGYVVTQADNGSDALNQLKLGLPPPSLILLDLAMPVLDGRGFLRRARSRSWLARVPVVLMADADQRPPPGTVAVLKKPIASNTLLKCVRRLFD